MEIEILNKFILICNIMSAKFFNIRNYDDSVEFSTLLGLYNKMISYLNPIAQKLMKNMLK
jgi:hypothetical protein